MKKVNKIAICIVLLSTLFNFFNMTLPDGEDFSHSDDTQDQLSTSSITIDWEVIWGVSMNLEVQQMAIDSEDNIYLCGFKGRSMFSGDVFLVKFNSSGGLQWYKLWGGPARDGLYYIQVAVDRDDNIFISGETRSFSVGYEDIFIAKYDKSGLQLWNRTWGGTGIEKVYSLKFDSHYNIYLGGVTTSIGENYQDFFLLKFNQIGDLLWNRTWGKGDWNTGFYLEIDQSNNIYFAGVCEYYGEDSEVVLLKYNESGSLQWFRLWASWGASNRPGGIIIDSKEDIYIIGDIFGYESGVYLRKYNSSGDLYWERPSYDAILFNMYNSLVVDSDDSVYISYLRKNGDRDVYLVKYNSMGIQEWEKRWGGSGDDKCYSIDIDENNNIYIVGETQSFGNGSNSFFLKYDNSGSLVEYDVWGSPGAEAAVDLTIDSEMNLYITGVQSSNIFLVKYNSPPMIEIYSPILNGIYGANSPLYNISASNFDVHSTWYQINGGLNYTFSDTFGKIDQTSWDNCENGQISIIFYANDTSGREIKEEIVVYKDSDVTLERRNAYAIIIGIEDYPGTINDLDYCVDDANSIYNLLRNTYHFQSNNIHTLLDSEATKSNIINAFQLISFIIKPGDLFFFYYSGHGGKNSLFEEYINPYDSISASSNRLYDSDLNSYLGWVTTAEQYIVIDACNSGGMIDEAQAPSRFFMTACEDNELSIETSAFRHGVFTYYFLGSLISALDSNGDGVKSMEEQFAYTYGRTVSYSSSIGAIFHPDSYDGITGSAVINPSIGSFLFTLDGTQLHYSFFLYGHGLLTNLRIRVSYIGDNVTIHTRNLIPFTPSSTGFGYYSGSIDIGGLDNVTGYEFLGKLIFSPTESKTFTRSYGDADGDTLLDFLEIDNGLDPSTVDTDNDGLHDNIEFYGITDPLLSDTDNDTMLDGYEVFNELDPLTNDADLDLDEDGLINSLEFQCGSMANNNDSDNDSMPDKWEYDNNLNLTLDDSNFDADNDGLNNIAEYQLGTDPQLEDTDGDSWSDGDEISHNTDPLDPEDYPRSIVQSDTSIPGYHLISILGVILIFGIILGVKIKIQN